MHRLFFALWPDPDTREKLVVVSSKAGITTGNPVANTLLHMTVAFLGTVDISRIEKLINAAASVSSGGFSLRIDQSGWWQPSRILWLAPRQVPDALLGLHTSITRLAGECDISVESRPYLPHITLVRNVNLPLSIEFEPIQWNVSDFCLVESIPHPGYVEYKIIQRWPLT